MGWYAASRLSGLYAPRYATYSDRAGWGVAKW
jgi:hypothetical protein